MLRSREPRGAVTSRRTLLRGAGLAAATLALGGCDSLSQTPWFRRLLSSAEGLTRTAQRAFVGEGALAREFSEADISPVFKANGTISPAEPEYQALAANGFADYRLAVDGLVERPLSLSLADLRALPARTQITGTHGEQRAGQPSLRRIWAVAL